MKIRMSLLLLLCSVALADDRAVRVEDRTAIERVYYKHRLGDKPPFEELSPPSLIERLVGEEASKEAVLKRAYGVEITPALLAAEVRRIDTTTRAPEMLAEIKAALGNDPARFANSFAKPILVERLLRERFENDDALHAAQRREVEQTRDELLSAKTKGAGPEGLLALLQRRHSKTVTETTWQLGARPAGTDNAPGADESEIRKRFGPDARVLSSPRADGEDPEIYFEDLPGELQKVLRVQLRRPGDVSAVIETPGGFLLYVAKEKTAAVLSVASLSLPKRAYKQWLNEQSGGAK